jgi:hypothetical protein
MHRHCSYLFLKQEKAYTFMTTKCHKHYATTLIILSIAHSLPHTAFTPIQNCRSLFPLMGCPLACPISSVPLRAWAGWHPLPDVGQGSTQCACMYSFTMGRSPVRTLNGHWNKSSDVAFVQLLHTTAAKGFREIYENSKVFLK